MAKKKQPTIQTGLDSEILSVIDGIGKKYGDANTVMVLGNAKGCVKEKKLTSSGSLCIDRAVGVMIKDDDGTIRHGIPRGKIVEVYGLESSGKTTLLNHLIAETQAQGKLAAFIDAEQCIAEGSSVYLADVEKYEKIENLVGKEITILSNVNNEVIKQKAIIRKTGEKETFKIRTEYGKEICLTGNHKVLSDGEYKKIEDLKTGDNMTILSEYISDDKIAEDDEKYKIVGYWLGDGTISRAVITNTKSEIAEDLGKISEKFFNSFASHKNGMINFVKKDNRFYKIEKDDLINFIDKGLLIREIADIYGCTAETIVKNLKDFNIYKNYDFKKLRGNKSAIVDNNKNEYVSGGNHIYNFLSSFDFFDKYANEKFIPDNLTKNQLRYVLSGLIMTDGGVIDRNKQKRNTVYFSTTSKRLLEGFILSLKKIGVISSFCTYKKKKKDNEYYRECYTVSINGIKNIKRLYDEIGVMLVGEKKEKIEKIIKDTPIFEYNEKFKSVKIKSIVPSGKLSVYDAKVFNDEYKNQNLIINELIVHNCWSLDYAKNIGVDVDKLVFSQPSYAEQTLDILDMLLKTGKFGIICLDSVAALSPQAELEGNVGDSSIGVVARLMSQTLRKINSFVNKTDTIVVFVNQLREKIGVMFGDTKCTTGGNSLKYYASVRIEIKKIGLLKDNAGEIIGNRCKVQIIKNKVAAPFKTCEFDIMYGEGIDRYGEMVDLACDFGIIEKKGSWFSYGGENIGQGRASTVAFLKSHKELADTLKIEILSKMYGETNDDTEENSTEEQGQILSEEGLIEAEAIPADSQE